jgi:hypothetical protein
MTAVGWRLACVHKAAQRARDLDVEEMRRVQVGAMIDDVALDLDGA